MSGETVTVDTSYFELLPGKIVDIQINHPVPIRFKTPLIGYELGKYIILKHPNPGREKNYRDVLVEGNVMIVRYLMEGAHGQCFAFRTTIRQVTLLPEKFIILDYPKNIENRELRMHQRIITHLPAKITSVETKDGVDSSSISGVIGDISAKGCGFAFKTSNEKVKVNERDIIVMINLPDEKVEIKARVCNSRYENGKVNVGIQFKDEDKQVQQVLEHLFIEQEN